MSLHTRASRAASLAGCIGLAAGLAACGGGDSEPDPVTLLKPTASLSCAPSQTTQANLDAQIAQLAAAGVAVQSGACGNAATALPAVCGTWNGDLWVVSVAPAGVAAAKAQGFDVVARFPSYVVRPC